MKPLSFLPLAAVFQLINAVPLEEVFFSQDAFIMNGQEAKIGELPHQLLLQKGRQGSWSPTCGAVLISRTKALTAAHCVESSPAREFRVIAGLHDKRNLSGTVVVGIFKYVKHPSYNNGPASYSDDIAVLSFEKPIKFSRTIQPIVWNEDENTTFAGERCVLSGWGRTEHEPISNPLMRVSMKIVSNTECQKKVLAPSKIYPGHICAHEPKFGACSGDSGGPMTCQKNGIPILAGITSWVTFYNGFCEPSFPSVYARVSHFKQFILDNLI